MDSCLPSSIFATSMGENVNHRDRFGDTATPNAVDEHRNNASLVYDRASSGTIDSDVNNGNDNINDNINVNVNVNVNENDYSDHYKFPDAMSSTDGTAEDLLSCGSSLEDLGVTERGSGEHHRLSPRENHESVGWIGNNDNINNAPNVATTDASSSSSSSSLPVSRPPPMPKSEELSKPQATDTTLVKENGQTQTPPCRENSPAFRSWVSSGDASKASDSTFTTRNISNHNASEARIEGQTIGNPILKHDERHRSYRGDCSISSSDSNNDRKSSTLSVNDDEDCPMETEEFPRKETEPAEVDKEIENLKCQIGKLWWAESNQDLRSKYERDKYGRLLIPDEERLGHRCDGGKKVNASVHTVKSNANITANVPDFSSSNTSPDRIYDVNGVPRSVGISDFYRTVIINVNCVSNNWSEHLKNMTARLYSFGDRVPIAGENVASDESLRDMDPKLQYSMTLADSVDKAWAKELYESDAQEREDIINELHGIQSSRMVNETPELVADAVRALREHIETNVDEPLDNGDSIVPPITKDAYKRAVFDLKSEYVQSEAFLVKFLRACFFDIDKAALRYFRYLDLLHDLFGDVALTRSLAMTDLTKREMRYLRKGQMQLLPSRDRAGRRMYAFSGCDDWTFNIREKYRINVYLVDVLADDATTQIKGAVSLNAPRIGTGSNPFGFEGMTLRVGKQELLGGKYTEPEYFRKINEAIPFRFSALHYFAPNNIIYNIGKSIILTLLGKEDRKVVRFHAGSQIECEYSLRSFGIPHEDLTITDGANIKTKNVQKFIKARQSIESFREKQRRQQQEGGGDCPQSLLKDKPGIECPEVDCIVFGDKALNNHQANAEFRNILKIVERSREEQLAIARRQSKCSTNDDPKTPIKDYIDDIIQIAKSPPHNLRFLFFDKNKHLYVEFDDHNELCKRVSQSLRDQRKRFRLEDAKVRGVRAVENEQRHQSQWVLDNGSIMGADAAKRHKRLSDGDKNCLDLF